MTREQVILLPQTDGGKGAVVVRQGASEVLLDKPYARARAGASGRLEVGAADPAAVKRDFGPVLSAMPLAPVSFNVYFIFGQDDLTEESRKAILPVLENMARRPAAEIMVIGHTDRTGPDAVNDALSLKRAERVKDMLVQSGIRADRIAVAGRGSREPLVDTPEGVSEPRNRRVEINVR